MAKFKSTSKLNKLKALGCAIALPLCAVGVGILPNNNITLADDNQIVDTFGQETVTVNNGSFQNGGVDYSGPSYSLSGWEAIDRNSNARGMIINVGSKFNEFQAQYKLSEYHRAAGDDDRILMINSRNDDTAENAWTKQGYQLSNNITLEANSYYRLTVAACASLDGRADGVISAYASIYVDGLKDTDGKDVPVYYEAIGEEQWKSYYFFIATGTQSQSINIQLYLGSKIQDSTGVAFFDEVNLTRFAESTFYQTISEGAGEGAYVSYAEKDVLTGDNFVEKDATTGSFFTEKKVNARYVIDSLKENDDAVVDTSELNFDFDDKIVSGNTLGDKWKTVYTTPKSHAAIMQVNGMNIDKFKADTGYDFVGADMSYNNKTKKYNQNALVLYNDEKSYVTVQSQAITLPAHAIYRISLRAKISSLDGNFKVGVIETENKNFGLPASYKLELFSKNGFTSNGEDKFHNNYSNVDLFVKGHDLYDTQFAIQLSLGTQDETAKGCVLFDNITVTRVDYAAYNGASTADKTEFKTNSENPSFTNGNFDFAENKNASLDYPLAAQSFTVDKTEYSESGIVYVPYDEAKYDALYKPQYEGDELKSGYDWYVASVGHPKGQAYKSTNNNIYMMYNSLATHQTLTTPTFTAGSDVTKISFDLCTISTDYKKAQIAVEITDENGIVLFYKDGISTNGNNWENVSFYIQGGETISSNLTLKIYFGQLATENYSQNLMKGYVLLDNFTSTPLDSLGGLTADVDLSDFYINLDPYGKVGENVSDSTAFTFDSTPLNNSFVGTPALGGVVKGDRNEYNVESDNNILVISAVDPSKNTLTSKFKLSLGGSTETPSYYKLTFMLRTRFSYDALENSASHKCESGVSVGIDGFEKATALRSDDDFTSYTIVFKSVASATPTIVFSLDCDCDNTCGNAYLTNIQFGSATEGDYTSALDKADNENKTMFASSATADVDDDQETPEPDENTTTFNADELWIIIPSLIMALTVIVAVVAFALRKVRFKKIEKTRYESYDRVAHVNHDIMLKRAQAQRDQEAQELRTALQEIADERAELEKEHKDAVKASRSAGGKVTKATERQFKAYAQAIARLGEKEQILHEQLEATMSADYLIEVERRLADEEEKMLKEMAKQKPVKEEAKAEQEEPKQNKK